MKHPHKSENWCVDCAHYEVDFCAIGMENSSLMCDGFILNVMGKCNSRVKEDSRDVQIIELKAAISAMADLLTETQNALEQKTARHNEAMNIIEKQRIMLQAQKECKNG